MCEELPGVPPTGGWFGNARLKKMMLIGCLSKTAFRSPLAKPLGNVRGLGMLKLKFLGIMRQCLYTRNTGAI
jgi:hypothetical protein